MKTAKRSKRKARGSSGLPDVVAVVADILLAAVVVVFGFSIAARFDPGRPKRVEAAYEPGHAKRAEPVSPREGVSRDPSGPGGVETGSAPAPSDPEALRGRPTVDIRNGCGRPKLGEEMMNRLRRGGFDVVECRNADRYDYAQTLVQDRAGKAGAAERLHAWLRKEYGVGEIVRAPVASPGVDVVLILGADLADTLARRARAERN